MLRRSGPPRIAPAGELPVDRATSVRPRARRWFLAGSTRWIAAALVVLAALGGFGLLRRSPALPPRDGDGGRFGLAAPAADGPGPADAGPVGPSPTPAPPEESGAVDLEKNRRVGEAIRRARASTVTVEYESGARRHVASGVVINDQGEILSIRIDPPADRARPSIIVCDAAGRRHPTRWLAMDADTGLTLLRADAVQLKPIRQAAGDPSLGSDIFLIGTPYGLGHSVSRGHIAGLGRRLTLKQRVLSGLIQIQASLHPGDSGALLADLDGGWLGLVRGSLAAPEVNAGHDDNLGFAIPARDALWVADRLRAAGKVDRAYLGLWFAADPGAGAELAVTQVPPTSPPAGDPVGAKVVGVEAGSPASRSGIEPGDCVTRIDDRPVTVADDLTERLDRTAAGAELVLEYVRGAIRGRATIRASSRPGNFAAVKPPATEVAPVAVPAAPAARAEGTSAALFRSMRDRLDQLERRVEQLEGADRDRRAALNP